LTKSWIGSEQRVFEKLASAVGIEAIEQVLLYHVVPGQTIDSGAALRADGAKLSTALPNATFTVDVLSKRYKLVRLIDNDRNDIDPFLNPRALDINKGNAQIAHGIVFVLRPADL
ncbi:MAG: fasciclin domain-containing protein, partial [Candidatus Phosphoribacter sp.]